MDYKMTTEIICGIEFELLRNLESDIFCRYVAEINEDYYLEIRGNETKGYECVCYLVDNALRTIGKSKEEAVASILVEIEKHCLKENENLYSKISTNNDCLNTIHALAFLADRRNGK